MPRLRNLDKKALRRSMWGAVSRLIGVGLGAGAGSMLHQLVGGGTTGWGVAVSMAVISLVLMIFAEYEREREL